MITNQLSHLSEVNRELLAVRDGQYRDFLLDPGRYVWWAPCSVRVLIVADGLDFSPANGFGLSTFVTTLLGAGWYVRFQITLAHIDSLPANSPRMMPGEPRIVNRITEFKFDNTSHFRPDMYDVVFLFGIDSTFSGRGPGYPADSLSDAELQALVEFQNGGGGLFATGDHGSLGRALCHKVARARNMRLWESTPNQLGEDMVSMTGRYRNDTNRIGHDAGSQFDDQSDDVPQPISPVLYVRRSGIFRYSYPHPLLCGPNGPIRVMPDHPHEGECRLPSNNALTLNYTAPAGPEYPAAIDGGARPLPEIISHNVVPSGNTSGIKDPTVAQSFPGICAYDGHRAGVGRVVTDATWHHFVNINLTGDPDASLGAPKRVGFLATVQGQAHFEEIKAYFRNLAVWLSRPQLIQCMNSHLLWHVIWHDRVLEAVLTTRDVGVHKVGVRTLSLVGTHARDVLGRAAGRCQTFRLLLELIEVKPRFVPEPDPWQHRADEKQRHDDDELPLIDLAPLFDAVLGGSLVAINERYGRATPEVVKNLKAEEVLAVARKGASAALEGAEASLYRTLKKLSAVAPDAELAPSS